MEDEKIIRLLRKDPNKGMEVLMDRFSGIVAAAVKGRLTGFPYCSADIEDCVAETFVKFYSSFESYRPDLSGIRTYLCVIARRTAANLTRSMRPILSIDKEEEPFEIPDPSFLKKLEEKEALTEALAAVKDLGKPDSDILLRKYYIGQTSKEIAADLGMTVSNVDTRAHRALEKLRAILVSGGKA